MHKIVGMTCWLSMELNICPQSDYTGAEVRGCGDGVGGEGGVSLNKYLAPSFSPTRNRSLCQNIYLGSVCVSLLKI